MITRRSFLSALGAVAVLPFLPGEKAEAKLGVPVPYHTHNGLRHGPQSHRHDHRPEPQQSPVGTVTGFLGDPADVSALGWVPCDGRAFSKREFPELFEVLGTTYGNGPNLPDLRARYFSAQRTTPTAQYVIKVRS